MYTVPPRKAASINAQEETDRVTSPRLIQRNCQHNYSADGPYQYADVVKAATLLATCCTCGCIIIDR